MKGPSLFNQFKKIQDENYRKDKQYFTVVEQIRYSVEYGEIHSYYRGHWDLVIMDNDKFNECVNKTSKELKCKECRLCALKCDSPMAYLSCDKIMRLELD